MRDGSGNPPNTPTASKNAPAKNFPKEIADAIRAGRFWEPQDIGIFILVRSGRLGVRDIAEELQRLVKKLCLSDDAILADQLLGLIRAMVARLNWLAEPGRLGDAPRLHETWPIEYAPDVSTGASKWETAKDLYQKLRCGKDAIITRIAGQVNPKDQWTELAEGGVRAALLAKHNAAAWVYEKIGNAKKSWHRIDRPYGHTKIECDYYLYRDAMVIAWPAWAERSRELPNKLNTDTWRKFWPVVLELVRIYLLGDEQRTREYLKAAKRDLYDEKKGWNSFIFDNYLAKKLKGALESLASR